MTGSGALSPGPLTAWIRSGAREPLQAVRPEVNQVAPRGEALPDEVRGHRREEDLAAVGLAAQPGREVERRAEVGGPAALGLAGVQPEAHHDLEPARPALGRQRMRGGQGGLERLRRRVEHRDRGVALAHPLDNHPATRLHLVGDDLVVADEGLRHRAGIGLPHRGGALDVRHAERHDAAGQGRAPAGPQPLDQLPGRLRPPCGLRCEAEPDGALELLCLRGVDALPGRQQAGRRRAGEQREGGRGQRVNIAGARRHSASGELGGPEPGSARAAPRRVGSRRETEVDELDAPASRQDQVRRLHVAVDHRRVLGVQVSQRLSRLGEIGEHAGGRQARAPAIAEQRGQVDAVDPVHRHDVAVGLEEVLAHEREGRVWRDGEQDARLAKQLLARVPIADLADLQRDEAIVLAVERLDHARLAARPERLEKLVAVLEKLSHLASPRPPDRTPRTLRTQATISGHPAPAGTVRP